MRRFAGWIAGLGAPGLFLMALADGLLLPLPGGVDVFLILLATREPDSLYALAITATIGSTIGNVILFLLARKGGEAYVHTHTLSRWGAAIRRWFQHYGLLTVFICALVPLPGAPLKLTVICAGALGAGPRGFVVTFLGARIARYTALAALGAAMGDDAIAYLIAHKWHLSGFALALAAFLFVLIRIADALRARRLPPRAPSADPGSGI
ncbi:MAG TPA: VTT domain-containing protein [Bryobacteraceae bacterium]|nr:VTT domain-containing protein [Bryobacteraceae bacterium]